MQKPIDEEIEKALAEKRFIEQSRDLLLENVKDHNSLIKQLDTKLDQLYKEKAGQQKLF